MGGDRATAPIENICPEKIRVQLQGLLNVR